jgi:hypothetical protein
MPRRGLAFAADPRPAPRHDQRCLASPASRPGRGGDDGPKPSRFQPGREVPDDLCHPIGRPGRGVPRRTRCRLKLPSGSRLVSGGRRGHTVLSPAAARRLIVASARRQPARDRAGTWPGRSPTARPRCWPASVRACPTRRSRPGCTCPKPGSRATSRGCWTSWAAPAAPRPACSPTTPRYRQPVARVGEAAGWNSGWVPGRPGCVLRPDVRARRVRRASRARRESAAVAMMSLTRSVASCCRISGCMGSSWVRRAAACCRAGRSGCRGTIRRSDRPGGR